MVWVQLSFQLLLVTYRYLNTSPFEHPEYDLWNIFVNESLRPT